MTNRFDDFYMSVAQGAAELSYAKRAQVGAVAVRDRNILAFGYNGTFPGASNECEDSDGKTKPDVIHAEENLLMKLARSSVSSEGSTMYITMSPCINCARLMANSGVKEVFYRNAYRDNAGIDLLNSRGISVEKM